MMKYFEWCCYNLISNDWKMPFWCYKIDENTFINIPLSLMITLHVLLISIAVFWFVEWLITRHVYKAGYTEGFKDGFVSKAVKLGKLKFGEAPHGIVLYDIGREEYSNEVETAFKEHQKKDM